MIGLKGKEKQHLKYKNQCTAVTTPAQKKLSLNIMYNAGENNY
jgi:hypothetical protein